MTGTLYGIGVGPGDPELITLKAHKILSRVEVVAYPAPLEGESLVRRIADPLLSGAQIEMAIRMPMVAQRFPAQSVYDAASEAMGAHLAAGRNVAVLCEGDPFFYGSFMYLYGRMKALYPVEVIPGVSSLTACAAALHAPLAARDDTLHVVPATLEAPRLRAELQDCDSAAIIKVGRHLSKVRGVLADLSLLEHARYVQHATMDHQQVFSMDELSDFDAPYFSMVLVHRRGEAWR